MPGQETMTLVPAGAMLNCGKSWLVSNWVICVDHTSELAEAGGNIWMDQKRVGSVGSTETVL